MPSALGNLKKGIVDGINTVEEGLRTATREGINAYNSSQQQPGHPPAPAAGQPPGAAPGPGGYPPVPQYGAPPPQAQYSTPPAVAVGAPPVPQPPPQYQQQQQQYPAQAYPPPHAAAPGVAAVAPQHYQQQQYASPPPEQPRTNDERWNLVWTTVKLYYLFDATKAFVIAFVSFVYTMFVVVTGNYNCNMPLWIPPVLIFITRCVDVCCGCCSMFRSFGKARSPDEKRFRFGKACEVNLGICIAQMIMAVGQITMAGTVLFTAEGEEEENGCKGKSVLPVVFGAVLFIDAGQEIFVWASCLAMSRNLQDEIRLPRWMDAIVPRCFQDFANKIG